MKTMASEKKSEMSAEKRERISARFAEMPSDELEGLLLLVRSDNEEVIKMILEELGKRH